MKSIITQKEERSYYLRTNWFLPVIMGGVFSVIGYIIYALLKLIITSEFELGWKYILIIFALGFFEGLSTIFITNIENKKSYKYYTNYQKKANTDFFAPATVVEGFLKNKKGTIVVNKDQVEFKVNQLFDKSNYFSHSFSDVKFELVYEANNILTKIFTFTKGKNILYISVDDKKYRLVIPSPINITHRLQTHPILGPKKG